MKKHDLSRGFSVIEVILAAAIFAVFVSASAALILSGFQNNRLGIEQVVATQFATEGLEAAKSIKNQSFSTLASKAGLGNQGIAPAGGVWTFSGTSNTIARSTSTNTYTRNITVSTVNRDSSGNIVPSPAGTLDLNTEKVTSTASWNYTSVRPESVPLSTYLTKWKDKKGGMLVYGNGGTTTDGVQYQIFDASINAWGAATTFDIDTSAANKVLQVERMYSSSTRDEKILISRLWNGATMYIYASVWNGTSWTSTQLVSWSAASTNDFLNFDGGYLNSGDFIVAYSNNTASPQFRTYSPTNCPAAQNFWCNQAAMNATALGGTPNWIVTQVRPGTNEVLTGFFTASSTTQTEYYNGSTWSAPVLHTSQAPSVTRRIIDIAWSPNDTTKAALVFSDGNNDKTMAWRICGAPCTAAANWGAVAEATGQGTNLGAMTVTGRNGANEFDACDKDASTTAPKIICYKMTFSGTNATVTPDPTNPALTNNGATVGQTDVGTQRSYDIDFESQSGATALAVFSDNSATPKFKKFTASSATWDANWSSITPSGTPGVLKSVRMIPQDQGDDMMILMGDGSSPPKLFSIFWDGANNQMYSTPTDKAYKGHGTNGSGTANFWYDFAWDKF